MTRESTNHWIKLETRYLCCAILWTKGDIPAACQNRAQWEEVRSREDIDAGIPARIRCLNCLPSDATKEES